MSGCDGDVDVRAVVLEGFRKVSQGAEANVYIGEFAGEAAVAKERCPKGYRHPALDQHLTQSRLVAEARALVRVRKLGIPAPRLLFVELSSGIIVMTKIGGEMLKEYLNRAGEEEQIAAVQEYGRHIARLHAADIIHGDLTTSNAMVTPLETSERDREGEEGEGDASRRLDTSASASAAASSSSSSSSATTSLPSSPLSFSVTLIDFGLCVRTTMVEDKAVDLYVLERAFSSTHPDSQPLFDALLHQYALEGGKGARDTLERLESVRRRGRKRLAFG